jgi:hypothetical protein
MSTVTEFTAVYFRIVYRLNRYPYEGEEFSDYNQLEMDRLTPGMWVKLKEAQWRRKDRLQRREQEHESS